MGHALPCRPSASQTARPSEEEIDVKVEAQYHSNKHEIDNRYHLDADCPYGNMINNWCGCVDHRPDLLCTWCDRRVAQEEAGV